MLARQMVDVAERAQREYHWLNDRVNGHAPIYADDIYALAQGLGRDPCDFFISEVEPSPVPSREDREPRKPLEQATRTTETRAERMARDTLNLFQDLSDSEVELLVRFMRWQREHRDE